MDDLDKTINYRNEDYSVNNGESTPNVSSSEERTEPLSPYEPDFNANQNINMGQDLNYQPNENSYNYCPNCGYSNKSGAQFCVNCGSPLNVQYNNSTQSEPIQNPQFSNLNNYDQYRELGGFLKFIVYANIILNPLSALYNLYIIFQLVGQMGLFFQYGRGMMIIAMILLQVVAIINSLLYIWLVLQIKDRNPNFLAYLDIIFILVQGTMFILNWIAYGFQYSLLVLFSAAIGIVLYNLYFIKSKRVHGYFGSEDYIRNNPFTRSFVKD